VVGSVVFWFSKMWLFYNPRQADHAHGLILPRSIKRVVVYLTRGEAAVLHWSGIVALGAAVPMFLLLIWWSVRDPVSFWNAGRRRG
jgi:hypothetical protein